MHFTMAALMKQPFFAQGSWVAAGFCLASAYGMARALTSRLGLEKAQSALYDVNQATARLTMAGCGKPR